MVNTDTSGCLWEHLLSSDVYQYRVDGHLEGIDNCVVIADDIIIFGFDNDGTNHDVRQVMQMARKVGMRFNPTKCQSPPNSK